MEAGTRWTISLLIFVYFHIIINLIVYYCYFYIIINDIKLVYYTVYVLVPIYIARREQGSKIFQFYTILLRGLKKNVIPLQLLHFLVK